MSGWRSRQGIVLVGILVAILLFALGIYVDSMTTMVTSGGTSTFEPTSGATTYVVGTTDYVRRDHPRLAESLWVAAAVVAGVTGWLAWRTRPRLAK